MAQVARPRNTDWQNALTALVALMALGLALYAVDPNQVAALQNFFLVFGSLLIEAVPFILLGAVVSAGIEVFVKESAFERLALLPRPLQLPVAGLAGVAFPVCECGSVPVARRMAAKGLAPSAAVTFMLAAPIINPVVLISTAVAYRGRDVLWTMVIGRAVLGLVAAMAVGWVLANQRKDELLRMDPSTHHDHDHDEGNRWAAYAGHLTNDFIFMGKYLVLGAAVAAAMQTFVPADIIGSVADTPVISLVAMMGLAYLLSLCSESDAFVAASFVQFGVGAQLAFLVFGPMVDTKLSFLYRGTYRKGFLTTVIVVSGLVTLAGTLWLEVFFG